jgi:CubicO group peptidase (beta-lactamase class C family)
MRAPLDRCSPRSAALLFPALIAALVLAVTVSRPQLALAYAAALPPAPGLATGHVASSSSSGLATGHVASPPQAHAAAIVLAAAIVRAHQAELEIPAISVAVGIGGIIVWADGFGHADLENRVPARATTLYRIGSVSKPVTAAAVVQLALDGRLELDAPVQRYVPSFPRKEHPITPRQLGGHLAGIRHYRGDESVAEGQRHYNDVVEALGIFGEDPLLFAPGEQYSYSSYGWNLISAVVQGAAGKPFLAYMQANVFDPLGLTHTHADDPRAIIPDRARFYETSGGGIRNAPFVDNSYKWAGGGFISSVEDLVRFGSAHLQPGFLPQEGLDLLFSAQRTNTGENIGYGIGWRVGTFGELFPGDHELRDSELGGLRAMHHGGSSVGGRAFLLLVPERRMVVAMLVNFNRFGGGRIAGEVAAAFLQN